MTVLQAVARAIWRETYRHDTLMEWDEIGRGTLHHKRTMAAARAAMTVSDGGEEGAIWLSIPGFPRYEASDRGHIRRSELPDGTPIFRYSVATFQRFQTDSQGKSALYLRAHIDSSATFTGNDADRGMSAVIWPPDAAGASMAGVPFLFCRYQFLVREEPLSFKAQLDTLQALQGRYFARGPKAERESHLDSIVMRPRELRFGSERAIAWSVGKKIGERQEFRYDQRKDQIQPFVVDDEGVVYSDFVAIPRLGVLGVDDRSSPHHLGGKAAMSRFKSIFRNIEGGAVVMEVTVTPQDVSRAFKQWALSEFSFVVRPYNPHPPGDLSKRLSEEFEKDGIGKYRAKAQPRPGLPMKPSADGPIAAATELADAGYGQYSVKGLTAEGTYGADQATKIRRSS